MEITQCECYYQKCANFFTLQNTRYGNTADTLNISLNLSVSVECYATCGSNIPPILFEKRMFLEEFTTGEYVLLLKSQGSIFLKINIFRMHRFIGCKVPYLIVDGRTEPTLPPCDAAPNRRLHRCHPHLRPPRVVVPRHSTGGASA